MRHFRKKYFKWARVWDAFNCERNLLTHALITLKILKEAETQFILHSTGKI